MEIVYLSRRNLLTLLSKLDRVQSGQNSMCSIIKNDTGHTKYPCTSQTIIIALEDKDYYTDRLPGQINLLDGE